MSRRCEICGKTSSAGRSITRSGSPKYKGGIGLHIGGISRRRFNPNVQKIKIVRNGTVKRVRVCSRCLKAGKVQRPLARPSQIKRSEEKEAARLAAEAEEARLRAEAEAATEAELAAAEAEDLVEQAAEAESAAGRPAPGKEAEAPAGEPTEKPAEPENAPTPVEESSDEAPPTSEQPEK